VHHTIAESLYARLPYSLERDFEPVTVAAFVPNVVVVHPKHKDKFKTLKDLIDYAKANPDKLNYGSAGSGTTHHLSVELFKTMTGTKLVHVPYKGAGPLMIDLLAGQVDLAFDGMGTSSAQVKAGKLIPLAITSAKRNPVLPNVPTVQEAGVPGYEVRTWYAVWAIKGTPPAIKERMYKEIVTAMNHPDLKRIWAEQGADPGGMPPAEMEKLVKSEIAKWAKVVKDAGARVDN
jgi:tripartite-type tricarboxylate transporter receptor subunit TctC